MENTVVHFIMENIFLFLPLGITGIIVTLFLYFTGKKETVMKDEDLTTEYKTILKIRINVYVLMYFFVWITIVVIGLLSDFFIPTLIGGIIAAIPFILMMLLTQKNKNLKV